MNFGHNAGHKNFAHQPKFYYGSKYLQISRILITPDICFNEKRFVVQLFNRRQPIIIIHRHVIETENH